MCSVSFFFVFNLCNGDFVTNVQDLHTKLGEAEKTLVITACVLIGVFLTTVEITNVLLIPSWLDQKRVSTLVGTACENLCVPWRSRRKQQQCISRCSHVHCLLPHMGMFSLCLCPCVSRQDTLNYFAQLPPWTLATARQYTHHADTRTCGNRDHSSCPSHTPILLDTHQTSPWNKGKREVSSVSDMLLFSGCLKRIKSCKLLMNFREIITVCIKTERLSNTSYRAHAVELFIFPQEGGLYAARDCVC